MSCKFNGYTLLHFEKGTHKSFLFHYHYLNLQKQVMFIRKQAQSTKLQISEIDRFKFKE